MWAGCPSYILFCFFILKKFCKLASVWRQIVIMIILEGLKISEVEDMKESKIVILRFMLKKKTVM